MLLLYALCACSALVWHSLSQSQIQVSHVYSSLAYVTPIISFLAVILAQWSIQGKLVTLPNFLEDYNWALKHLNASNCYYVDDVHAGYRALEIALEKTDEHLKTPRLVALVEHYTKIVVNTRWSRDDDLEAECGQPQEGAEEVAQNANINVSEAEKRLVAEAQVDNEYVYWQFRLLFNPRLQDDRSQNFRNWALAYMVTVMLAVFLSIYLYICCLVTCLEIERVLIPGTPTFAYLHCFSLRPDLGHSSHKSLKQMAASAALSFMSHGAKAFYTKATGALPHFQLGAAA